MGPKAKGKGKETGVASEPKGGKGKGPAVRELILS
jgi:hypothetical protein